MTISNLRCDLCDGPVPGLIATAGDSPHSGVRFSYHPGDPRLRDDSGVVCRTCWAAWVRRLGEPSPRVCAICGSPVAGVASLHLRNLDTRETWQLCAPHAADLLNGLTTVDPKLDPATFRLPLAGPTTRSSDA